MSYAHLGADVTFKWYGLSAASEVMYRSGRSALPAGDAIPRSGWGVYLQGGYMLSPRWEVTSRYSRLEPRSGSDPGLLAANELGAGVSRYLQGHDLKVQGDVFTVTDAISGQPGTQTRVQLQLFF